ncbi:MAG: prepilin-type N-terminal cleavage/methylation domain-containing protein [bacterium]|nr:prepilin-type N-terminal cleavage/methylation domain-containing protein [bacterium]
MAHHRNASQGGFEILEVLIVLAIVAILAAVAIPAFVRYAKLSRTADTTPVDRAEAVRTTERSGIKNADVVATHTNASHRWQVGCRGDNDVAFEVEGIDGREQRVRTIVCCRPASTGPICALPPRSVALPPER